MQDKCRCTGWGNCGATPEEPCFCPCHLETDEEGNPKICNSCECENKEE